MIRDVLGPDSIAGDEYYLGSLNHFENLLDALNGFSSCIHITRADFRYGKAGEQIDNVLAEMNWKHEHEALGDFRLDCFRTALSMRSRQSCSVILRAHSFRFFRRVWARLR